MIKKEQSNINLRVVKMVYRTINFTITGQVKDKSDGLITATIIKNKLELLALEFDLELEGDIGF